MAKLTCLLALFVVVVVCAEAVRIDTAEESDVQPIIGIKKKDPRCKGRTGLFPVSKDCKKYIKCVRGDSREMTCHGDKKFDLRRHCISPKQHPKCKSSDQQQGPTDAYAWCPRAGGKYAFKSDCRKYYVCKNYEPTVFTCEKGMFYSELNGMCIKADKCPKPKSEAEGGKPKCTKANELIPDPKNCRKYFKCVNFKPQSKNCPPGSAFNDRWKTCTKKRFEECKNNDILHIEPDDE